MPNRAESVVVLCYFQNVRGLRGKVSDLCSRITSGELSIIDLVETWLPGDILSSEYFLNLYTIYRCDRHFDEFM